MPRAEQSSDKTQTVKEVGEAGNTEIPEAGNHHSQLQEILLID